jgi:hypothetical protein
MGASNEPPDLWVTERCYREDLGEQSVPSLADLASRYDAVKVFVSYPFRSITWQGGQTNEAVVEIIADGQAVVWVDDRRGVVWLLEVPSAPLDDEWEDRWLRRGWEYLLPTERDDAALARHRGRTSEPRLMASISATLDVAMTEPGQEHGSSLPDGATLGILVRLDPPSGTAAFWVTIEQRNSRISDHVRVRAAIRACLPELGGAWKCDPVKALPHRELDATELALYYYCEGSWDRV